MTVKKYKHFLKNLGSSLTRLENKQATTTKSNQPIQQKRKQINQITHKRPQFQFLNMDEKFGCGSISSLINSTKSVSELG